MRGRAVTKSMQDHQRMSTTSFMGERPSLTDLDMTLGVEKDIIRFDISMNDTLSVQVLQSLTRLLETSQRNNDNEVIRVRMQGRAIE